MLLSWAHSGFSVQGSRRVLDCDRDGLDRLGRTVTWGAMPTDAASLREEVLDPLELVHARVTQIPGAGGPRGDPTGRVGRAPRGGDDVGPTERG